MENGEVGEEGKRVVVVVKEEEENPLKITTCHHNKCCLFTEAQRRELDYQVFIFNHFAYNLPISHCRFQFPTNMSGLSKKQKIVFPFSNLYNYYIVGNC